VLNAGGRTRRAPAAPQERGPAPAPEDGDAPLDLEADDLDGDYEADADYLIAAPAFGVATAGLGDATAGAVAAAVGAGYSMIDAGEVVSGGGGFGGLEAGGRVGWAMCARRPAAAA
jgi:hypothetical protein